jgi:vancomycin resistance protein YoaR
VAGLFAADGAVFAVAFWPESHDAQAAPVVPFEIGGIRVTAPAGQAARDVALALARRYLSEKVTITGRGFSLERTRQELGARVELERLERLITEARTPGSSLLRTHAAEGGGTMKLPMPAHLDDRAVTRALLQLKQDYDRRPLDARIDLATGSVLPETYGRRLHLYDTLAKLDDAVRSGARRVPVARESLAPRLFAKQLHDVDVDSVIGFFETRFATDEEHRDRAFNLRVAAKKLDGHIILPGERFSFNAAVGERSEVQGFRTAKVIAAGELVDGLGGGTCQIASTLHAAAYFAGLEIIDRRPHSRPSWYIKMGLDATVVYPNIDLVLRNPFDVPIVLRFDTSRGIARAEILGPRRDRSVTFVRHIDEVAPFPERTVDDPTLPRGARVLKQRGIDGYTIRRYRVIRRGAVAVRETATDEYPPTAQIWRVGTGTMPLDPATLPEADPHPEYLADEFLWLTQGPEVRTPTGFVEVKRPGRTGVPRGPRGATASSIPGTSTVATATPR